MLKFSILIQKTLINAVLNLILNLTNVTQGTKFDTKITKYQDIIITVCSLFNNCFKRNYSEFSIFNTQFKLIPNFFEKYNKIPK